MFSDNAGDQPKAPAATNQPSPHGQPAVGNDSPAAGNHGVPSRPDPRPIDEQRSSGNTDGFKPEPADPANRPTPPGRYVPHPGAQPSPSTQGEPANVSRPTPRIVENSGTPAANADSPRNLTPATPRPGASTGVVRRSVENVQSSSPPAPQNVSMPRDHASSSEPSHAHTVVTAPRENNSRHENSRQNKSDKRPEEKSDRKQNR
jgi:hypothetical protein